MRPNISVEVTKNKLPQVRANFPVLMKAIIAKTTMDVYARSQQTVPVRKDQRRVRGGALKASGQHEVNGYEGKVSYGIYYAVYVHNGTRFMAARPFLTDAFNATMPGMRAALAQLESRLL